LSSQQAAQSPSPRIYVVDDDQSVRTAIARLLGENGFEVETFPSAPAFLSRYQAVGPACVIVDQRMPVMSGLDLQGLLAERDGTLSVVFLTAFGDVAASVQAMKGGAIDFLIKPVEEDVLIAALRDFGVFADHHPVHRGVWVNNRKIASLGIRISRWVTMHGFALNVSTDLSYFSLMNPCGISGCVMTSMETEMAAPVAMNAVRERIVAHFGDVFDREMRTEAIAHVH